MSENNKQFKILLAVAAILIGVAMFFWLQPDADWQGVKVISGQTDSVNLPDGSQAVLTGPAQIGFPKTFSDKVRAVKMKGQIFFKIKEDAKRNFLVQTDKGGIETKVAQALVRVTKKDSLMVLCQQGSLRMIGRGKKGICEAELSAGQTGIFWRKNTEIFIQDSMNVLNHFIK